MLDMNDVIVEIGRDDMMREICLLDGGMMTKNGGVGTGIPIEIEIEGWIVMIIGIGIGRDRGGRRIEL